MFKKNRHQKQKEDRTPNVEAGFVIDLNALRKENSKDDNEEGQYQKNVSKNSRSSLFKKVWFKFQKGDYIKGVDFVADEDRGMMKRLITRKKKRSFGIFDLFKWIYKMIKGTRWTGLFIIRFFWILSMRIIKFSAKNIIRGFQNSRISLNLFKRTPKKKKEKKKRNIFKFRRKKKESKVARLEEQWEKNKLIEEASKHKKQLLRSLTSFIVLALLLVVPFKALTYYNSLKLEQVKNNIIHSTKAATQNLQQASISISNLHLAEASDNFTQASDNFTQAQNSVQEINGFLLELTRFFPQKEAKLASASQNLIQAGKYGSSLGNNLTLAFNSVLKVESGQMIPAIDDFQKYGDKAIKDLNNLNQTLSYIDEKELPEEYGSQLAIFKESSKELKRLLNNVVGITDELKILLGEKHDRKYLLIFQNNNEIRATGGFMGSYALVKVSEGEIEDIEVPDGGTYDVEAGMTEFIQSPEPLHLVDPLWHFWDANWWPDWPTSARNLMDFYEDSGGPTVDGVISLTPTVLQRVLEVTGPIELEGEYNLTIDANNCEETLRNIIEKEAGHLDTAPSEQEEGKDVTNPKKIIGMVMDKVVTKVSEDFSREKLVELMEVTNKSLGEKHILFYFNNKKLQQEIEKRNWDGRIKENKKDYLSVINTNIGGQKSDKKIKQNISHRATVQKDGTIINKVEIERTHTGQKNAAYYGARNVNWMRIYVPEDSRLINAAGFDGRPSEVYFEDPLDDWEKHPLLQKQEQTMTTRKNDLHIYDTEIYKNGKNKTVFANWSILDPGETEVIKLKYELPFKLTKNTQEEQSGLAKNLLEEEQTELYPYSLYIQRQPGTKPDTVQMESELILPSNYSFVWKYPKKVELQQYSAGLRANLNKDKYWAVLLKK